MIFSAILPIDGAFADDAADAKRKYQELQRELQSKRSRLSKAEHRETATLNELDKTNRRLTAVSNELRRFKGDLDRTRKEIELVKLEIYALQGRTDKSRQWLKRRLRAMNQYGMFSDKLMLLAASTDLSQANRRWLYLERIAESEQKVIKGFMEGMTVLELRRQELASLESRLREQELDIKRAEKELAEHKGKKEKILSSIRDEKSAYQRMIEELNRSSEMMLRIIRDSEKRKASRAVEAGDIRAMKGELPWPLSGKIAVPYGSQKDARFDTPIFRNGIYIAADKDRPAKAVYGGEVVYADWFKGYGKLVIINHGDGYHTLYANLDEIFLKMGDIIKIEDEVGRIGSSGVSDAPSLYFEIRYKGKPLDPSQWLRKK